MKQSYPCLLYIALSLTACQSEPEVPKEPWIHDPVSAWPDLALTNEIAFGDTTYEDLANAFLIDTGADTVGVTCKHLFLVFQKNQGLKTIDLGESFRYWKLYPKGHPEKAVQMERLINRNVDEPVDQFNTLKLRDWLLLELPEQRPDLYPLKIRFQPVKPYEVVYAVGWGRRQEQTEHPALIKMEVVQPLRNYFYVKTLDTAHHPEGRSGSAVIDADGYLVGVVSGAEGKLGVIGGVNYLKKVMDDYGVKYEIRNQK